ncbi:MAG: hypothetical protein AAGJ80_07530, partial [Cyanobacteria bacterium J06553_1]
LTRQRMRRLEENGLNIVWALLNAIDVSLYSFYLAAVEEENDAIRRANISNEFFSALPNLASIARSLTDKVDPITAVVLHVGHVATDVVAAVVTATTGGILIREANKALNEAEAAI